MEKYFIRYTMFDIPYYRCIEATSEEEAQHIFEEKYNIYGECHITEINKGKLR